MAKILVIDDEKDIADLIKLVLELDSHDVTVITESDQAVSTALSTQPELILLDLVMPKVDGYDILREFRTHESLAKIPVAFLTSKSKSVDFMVGLHMMKVDDYITKPFGKKDLLCRVQNLLSKSEKKS
jgi:two-component system response regulator VicR